MLLYLIEILHQTTTTSAATLLLFRCILSKFYIKPQPSFRLRYDGCRCILSKFYIKPQPTIFMAWLLLVVSYRNSTSNHNGWQRTCQPVLVVSYRNSTSNHNVAVIFDNAVWLYLIEILHQTTTAHPGFASKVLLYLIEILHQTTTLRRASRRTPGLYLIEILHQTTTPMAHMSSVSTLYLIEILHQTTTRPQLLWLFAGCILSKFYIKPQPSFRLRYDGCVVSYRNSTSNHNSNLNLRVYKELYLIEILHQTTTVTPAAVLGSSLYLIEILHQTTTVTGAVLTGIGLYLIEILHQTTTFRKSSWIAEGLYLIEILHQTTTSGLILIDKVLLTGCLPL